MREEIETMFREALWYIVSELTGRGASEDQIKAAIAAFRDSMTESLRHNRAS